MGHNKLSRKDTLFAGWQDGKFVLLVMNADKEIKHRISCTVAEWDSITAHSEKNAQTALVLKEHEQIDTDEPLSTMQKLPRRYQRFKNYRPTLGRTIVPCESERYGNGLMVNTFLGKPAFSNGHVMLIGDLPDGYKKTNSSPDFARLAKPEIIDKSKALIPVARQRDVCIDPHDEKSVDVIWFDREYPVDARYFDFIVERFPEFELRTPLRSYAKQQTDPEAPYLIFESSTSTSPVGALMPMRYKPDDTITQLMVEHRTQLRAKARAAKS